MTPSPRQLWRRFPRASKAVLAMAYLILLTTLMVSAVTSGRPEPSYGQRDMAPSSTTKQPLDGTSSSAATGRDLYLQHCASCHGPSLEGGVGPELGRGSEAAEETDNRLVSRITEGTDTMPGFADKLSDGEVARLLEYVRGAQSGS